MFPRYVCVKLFKCMGIYLVLSLLCNVNSEVVVTNRLVGWQGSLSKYGNTCQLLHAR